MPLAATFTGLPEYPSEPLGADRQRNEQQRASHGEADCDGVNHDPATE